MASAWAKCTCPQNAATTLGAVVTAATNSSVSGVSSLTCQETRLSDDQSGSPIIGGDPSISIVESRSVGKLNGQWKSSTVG